MDKNRLRKIISAKRDEMKSDDVESKSRIITSKFIEKFSNFNTFLLYMNFKNEVETFSLIKHLSDSGKKVFLPKLKNKDIFPSAFEGFEKMEKNSYGIMEPVTFSEIKDFDVAVVPAVAFDKKCNRLGFGKGYYDKMLPKLTIGICVGFAYEFQVVENVEVRPHDIPVDVVITEEKNYRRN